MTLRQKYKSEYKAFKESKARCTNKNLKNYNIYGGRGIQHNIDTFEIFINHIGPKPSKGHSLDRIDNNGNYEVGNIRWLTQKEQCRNQRKNILHIIKGVEKTLIEWCEIYNINYKSVYRRINRFGWSVNKSLNTPIRVSGRLNNSGTKYIYEDKRRNRWNFDRRIEGVRYLKTFRKKEDAIEYAENFK